ncbi:VPA1262 family N-terminal domain-containing protein [Tepidibacter mesophilus]|uniref:VPA1262 family N-terminal domain-containing protein n=1 Tax=Tepidibacter mesophilus TaxID=655607 RepID=UPI000C07501A|nr:VPA1262 family N-terminal domain-containing protein [Tepidibacter mesophilus]
MKQSIINDFNLLINPSNLGFYESCEILTIFLYDKRNKKTYNFYTSVVLEEKPFQNNKETFLTDKLIKINEYVSMGIIKYYEDIEKCRQMFNILLDENKWSHGGNELEISNLEPVPKQFIKPNGTLDVPLNSILKNNYYSGSYILEFFDEDKYILNHLLDKDEIDQLCVHVNNLIPIDLGYIRDRIGNIIFQFPSNLLIIDHSSLEKWNGIHVDNGWHTKVIDKSNFCIKVLSEFDSSIIGFGYSRDITNASNNIHSGNSNMNNDIIIFNCQNQLIVAYLSGSFMKGFSFKGFMSTQHSEKRIVKYFDKEGNLLNEDQIELQSLGIDSGSEKKDYFSHISNRVYENEKKKLERSLFFVQYGKNANQRNKALHDIRTLIKKHGTYGIYLWDPFLDYQDIVNTLYYSEIRGVKLRAIGSYVKRTKKVHLDSVNIENNIVNSKNDFQQWKETQENGFESNSNNVGINMEFRCQHSEFGWKFHDRFLIFPSKNGRPLAWSLGTSVNSIGKEHHILQKVDNAQIILDAFDELWEELNNPECIVWRKK